MKRSEMNAHQIVAFDFIVYVMSELIAAEKEIHAYKSEAEAEKAKDGYIKAFGRQLWACVREKRG